MARVSYNKRKVAFRSDLSRFQQNKPMVISLSKENRKRTDSDCYLRCDQGGIAQGLKSSIQILSFFRYAAPRARSEKTKWAVVMSEFAPIFIYLVISPLVSLIPLGVPFPFASNSSTYPEKLSAYECGFDPFGDARSRFDIRFYLVSILFIIPDPEVTFSFPWAVPPNKIDPFGSWSMMAFLLILTIGSLYEWKRGASDRE